MKTLIHDAVLGDLKVRRHPFAKHVSVSIAPQGQLIVVAPLRMPLVLVRHRVAAMRNIAQQLLVRHVALVQYRDKQLIGRSHKIVVVPTQMVDQPSVSVERSTILVCLPPEHQITTPSVQKMIREHVRTVLRKEAKMYLPQRLALLAKHGGFHYQRVRLQHASSRWGSCSSNGTISLNIALMLLPDELIDYVLVHELCHTSQMNHSSAFWRCVERYDPNYKHHRTQLRQKTPVI